MTLLTTVEILTPLAWSDGWRGVHRPAWKIERPQNIQPTQCALLGVVAHAESGIQGQSVCLWWTSPAVVASESPLSERVCARSGQWAERRVSWEQKQKWENWKRDNLWSLLNKVNIAVMAVWLSGVDPSRETNDVDITSCSQYANTMSSTKEERKIHLLQISCETSGKIGYLWVLSGPK